MDNGKFALLPVGGMGELMGGHKGYGLATMVEIFSAAFQNGTYLWGLTDTDAEGKPQFLRIGHFFLAINVEHFIPLDRVQAHHRQHDARSAELAARAGPAAHLYSG